MVAPEKINSALKAIQHLVILARKMAYDKEDHARIAALLDGTEYLPGLMLEEEDRTEAFREYLAGIADQFGWPGIIELYDSGFGEDSEN